MVPEASVRVLGQPPFHATALTSSGALSYVGGNWERDIAFAGYSIPLAVCCVCAGANGWLSGGRWRVGGCRCWRRMPDRHAPACPTHHLQGDIPAAQMLNSLPGIDPARRDRLVEVLDIDPTWRMHLVSGALPG